MAEIHWRDHNLNGWKLKYQNWERNGLNHVLNVLLKKKKAAATISCPVRHVTELTLDLAILCRYMEP